MIALGLGLVACGDDGGEEQNTTQAETSAETSEGSVDPDSTSTTEGQDEDGDCVPGNQGCICLEDACIGGLFCVEAECVLGPQVEIDEGRAVVGGVVVPIEADVMADEFSWSQVAGPAVEILGAEGLQIAVVVPADAPPGEVVTLRLTAIRNTVAVEADVDIEILDSVFEDFLAGIDDPMELGSTEGLAFGADELWVVSSEGFVSRFDPEGAFILRHDVPGTPAGAGFSGENLIIANPEGSGRVEQLNSVSGNLGLLFDTFDGGPVGTVNLPLPDNNGNVFVSTRLDQRVLRYDAELGSASLFIENLGENPNALAFGPEGNVVYVGTVGHVWRVPLLEGGGAGQPEDYLDLGDDMGITYEVDGLVFDEGNNLWIGCPNASSLFVAQYSVQGPAEVARSWVEVGGVSRFVNLRFGEGDFGQSMLYWTNLGDGSVGRLRVGLQEINAPLAN